MRTNRERRWDIYNHNPHTILFQFHLLLNGFQNILFIWKFKQTFCHNQFILNPDRQFTDLSFWIERDIDPGVLPDINSRTECIDPVVESYQAKSDNYFFHFSPFIDQNLSFNFLLLSVICEISPGLQRRICGPHVPVPRLTITVIP